MFEQVVKYVKRAILALAALALLLFAGDYLLLQYRISGNRNPYGTVQVRPYYAVRMKNGKTEFMFADPQDETCVHSLLPHLGDRPCWYAETHTRKEIDMK